MTDSTFLLSVLNDGEPHSLTEILRASINERGCGMTVHSRAAELRKQGHIIICDRVPGAERGDAWTYRLLGSLSERDAGKSVAEPSHRPTYRDASSRSESEQSELFTYPRSPEWA